MQKLKSGFLTSEFLVVVLTAVLSVAVAAGIISPEQSVELRDKTAQLIQAIADFVGALTPLAGMAFYVWSRTKVKQASNGK